MLVDGIGPDGNDALRAFVLRTFVVAAPRHQVEARLVDDELPAEKLDEVRRMLEDNPELQQYVARSRRLKELLAQIVVPDPGRQYWDETTSLILARTVEAEAARVSVGSERFSLVRSLFSVAASIIILISALYIGSNGRAPMPLKTDSGEIAFAAVSVQKDISPGDFPAYGHKEALQLARAMIVMGPPGMFGRCLLFPERVDNNDRSPST